MPDKPKKPYKDFPLYAHGNGQWAKKIRGQTECFGKWNDPESALQSYLDLRDELQAGRKRKKVEEVTVGQLCQKFMDAKRRMVESGDLSERSLSDYDSVCKFIAAGVGGLTAVSSLGPTLFGKLRVVAFRGVDGRKVGPVAGGNKIRLTRSVFKWGKDSGLLSDPVDFGPDFKVPSKLTMRKDKQARPKREFTAGEIRKLIGNAEQPLKSMILLGINCGLGNSDCGQLRRSHLDLHDGWLHFPRPKTAIEREAKLWPETVASIEAAIAERPSDASPASRHHVFLTRHRQIWHRDSADSPISNELAKLCEKLKIKRQGVNFYSLRHTFETVAGDTGDQVAVNRVMGHTDESMAAIYTTTVFKSRLTRISEHVRAWLYS